MAARVTIRCYVCGWTTTRAPQPDHDYGRCRCERRLRFVMRAVVRLVDVATVPAQPAPESMPCRNQNATWPELFVAALEDSTTRRALCRALDGL